MFAFHRDSSYPWRKVLGSKFTSQKAEKGFILASFPKSFFQEAVQRPVYYQVWLEQTLSSPGLWSVLGLAFEGAGVEVILGTWLLEARLEFGQVSQGSGLDGAVMCYVPCRTHCQIILGPRPQIPELLCCLLFIKASQQAQPRFNGKTLHIY